MGCNCKKPQVLNNTKSVDHLNLLFKIHNELLSVKSVEEYNEADSLRVRNVFVGIYPNVKTIPQTKQMVTELITLYQQNKK
jgi:hypothetical protein